MYELKKNGKVFTSEFVGTGPSSYEERIYQAAVSQRLRDTALHGPFWRRKAVKLLFCPMVPYFWNNITLPGSHNSSTSPSGKKTCRQRWGRATGGNYTDRRNRSTLRKTCPSANFSTKNSTLKQRWKEPNSNNCGERSASIRPSHGTIFWKLTYLNYI